MGKVVIVVYKPKPGKVKEFFELLREHVPVLTKEKLITDRKPIILRSKSGAIVEIFEWASAEAIDQAHGNANVQKLWEQFNDVCDYAPLSALEERDAIFPDFDSIN